MAQFQNYLPNQSTVQPTYPNYNNPMIQPNQYDRMAQLQNYNQGLQQQFPPMQQAVPVQTVGQQVPIAAGLNGKIVPAVENIAANDVPMDGSIAFFPKQDMTEIYAKAWNADGTIRTVVYRPVEPVLDGQTNMSTPTTENLKIGLSDETTEAFMRRFDDISDRLEQLELTWTKSSTNQAKTSTRTKKEVISNE